MRLPLLSLLIVGIAGLARADAPHDAAIALYKSKDYPAARAAFEQLALANPSDAQAQFYLGNLAQRRGDTDEAIKYLETATALSPGDSDYFMELGGAYGAAANKASLLSKLGFAKKCQAALEKAVALNPDNLVARNGLITFYRTAPSFAGGGIAKAYAEADEIRKRDPVMGATVLAQLYIAERRYAEAFALFEEVLVTHPDHYLALYSIGRTASQSGLQLERGEQALRRCLDLPPGKGDPNHAAVHWRLGNLAEMQRDPAKARAEYEAALKVDANFAQAKESLAKLSK